MILHNIFILYMDKNVFSTQLIQKYPILNEYITKSGVLSKRKKKKILEILNEEETKIYNFLFVTKKKNNSNPLIINSNDINIDDINYFSASSERVKMIFLIKKEN